MLSHLDGNTVKYSFEDLDLSIEKGKEGFLGQERAVSLLSLALRIKERGYNIYLSTPDEVDGLYILKEEVNKLPKAETKDTILIYSKGEAKAPCPLTLTKGDFRKFQTLLKRIMDGESIKESETAFLKDENNLKCLDYVLSISDKADISIKPFVEFSEDTSVPFIVDMVSTHESIFGTIEKENGHIGSIVPGSFQKASGGILALSADEVLNDDKTFRDLKRFIDSSYSFESIAPNGSAPSIPNNAVKVVLIGSEELYDKFSDKDESFLKYFKASPELDYTMDNNRDNASSTALYLINKFKGEFEIDKSAINEILRFSSVVAEDRKKLTAELEILSDLLREAKLYSDQMGNSTVDSKSVRMAIDRRSYHNATDEEKINKEIERGIILMDLKGERVGVINGLAVMDRGLSSYGTPVVISATVAPGSEGIVNIEHEAGLSGGIHDKGILILEGYLRHKYARSFPLSLYAGICLEQSYGEIDGDSASSAELCALLSAIGGIPIRQDIAITGSVNQMGLLQPVGGINEKITGFYRAAKTLGLTGTQGVIIPSKNVTSIILPYEIEKSVADGKFHIWAIDSIDDGFELLSGLRGGERDRRGSFPVGSFNRTIEDELKRIYKSSQKQNF